MGKKAVILPPKSVSLQLFFVQYQSHIYATILIISFGKTKKQNMAE